MTMTAENGTTVTTVAGIMMMTITKEKTEIGSNYGIHLKTAPSRGGFFIPFIERRIFYFADKTKK